MPAYFLTQLVRPIRRRRVESQGSKKNRPLVRLGDVAELQRTEIVKQLFFKIGIQKIDHNRQAVGAACTKDNGTMMLVL